MPRLMASPVEGNGSAVCFFGTGNYFDESRFTSAIFPYESVYSTAPNGHIGVDNSFHPAVALGDVGYLDAGARRCRCNFIVNHGNTTFSKINDKPRS
jgi:hypothetical protein